MTPAEALARELDSEFKRIHSIGRTTIRKATKADLAETLEWLTEEDRATGHSFICNRDAIERSQRRGSSFVARAGNRCLGYLMDSGYGPAIVAVRPEFRRLGIGRRLATYSIKRARRNDHAVAKAACVTEGGRKLCESVGFKRVTWEWWELPLKVK